MGAVQERHVSAELKVQELMYWKLLLCVSGLKKKESWIDVTCYLFELRNLRFVFRRLA